MFRKYAESTVIISSHLLSVAMTKPWPKVTLGRSAFHYICPSKSLSMREVSEATQSKSLDLGAEAKAMGMLLSGFL